MAQVLIRDLDEKVLKALKQRAESNHRSLQRELHLILSQATGPAAKGGINQVVKRARVREATKPTGSVWNWLKRPAAGNLSKEDIDRYIRAERDSWNAA